jgi:hypothetical protein
MMHIVPLSHCNCILFCMLFALLLSLFLSLSSFSLSLFLSLSLSFHSSLFTCIHLPTYRSLTLLHSVYILSCNLFSSLSLSCLSFTLAPCLPLSFSPFFPSPSLSLLSQFLPSYFCCPFSALILLFTHYLSL